MLDKNFVAMTNFLMLSSVGKCNIIPDDIDLSAVLKYASEHAVIPLVVAGIKKHGKYSAEPILETLEIISMQMVAKNIQNGFVVKNIFEDYKKENIDYAVLKGESIATLYNEPDLRISGDIDLLVSEKDEKKVLKILEKYGYFYEVRPAWFNETICKHKNHKNIEVHTELFDESRNDIFFKNTKIKPKRFSNIITSNYGEISALNPDDGILFVFLHFVKHFLSSGAGIRQFVDVIVYSRYYLNEIDWDKFLSVLKEICYFDLFRYLISIATEFLGMPKDELPDLETNKELAYKVLIDLQVGGIFGYNQKELEKFKEIYEKRRYEAYSGKDYRGYAKKHKRSKFRLIFPSMVYMKRKYPYLVKYPFLVFFAWVDRTFKATVKLLSGKRNISDYDINKPAVENEKIIDRMKLMEELGLI